MTSISDFTEYLRDKDPQSPLFLNPLLGRDNIDYVHFLLRNNGYILVCFDVRHNGNCVMEKYPADYSQRYRQVVNFYYVNPTNGAYINLFYYEYWHYPSTEGCVRYLSFGAQMDITYPYRFFPLSDFQNKFGLVHSGFFTDNESKIMLHTTGGVNQKPLNETFTPELMDILKGHKFPKKKSLSAVIIKTPNVAQCVEKDVQKEIYDKICSHPVFIEMNPKRPPLRELRY